MMATLTMMQAGTCWVAGIFDLFKVGIGPNAQGICGAMSTDLTHLFEEGLPDPLLTEGDT